MNFAEFVQQECPEIMPIADLPGVLPLPDPKAEPATFDQVHEQLNRMGDWTDVTDMGAKKCPDLLETAQQANHDVDRDPGLIGKYYQSWRAVFLAVRER